jgi:hypothetical protein
MTGLALAVAVGTALYFVLRPADPPEKKRSSPPLLDSGGSLMPDKEARQLQANLNTIFSVTRTGSPIAVNGRFTYDTLVAVGDLCIMCAVLAENGFAVVKGLEFLGNPYLFYSPTPSNSLTIKLHDSTKSVALRDTLYHKLADGPVTLSDSDIRMLQRLQA